MKKVLNSIRIQQINAKKMHLKIKKPRKETFFLDSKHNYAGIDYFSRREEKLILGL
jgi:hypothetical protein